MNKALTASVARATSREELLRQLERKLLWLSGWMIHSANHIRPNRDGLKVGGHQASCASVISIMAAVYFEIARPQDRIAVKPHAGPVFHAINYLFGRQEVAPMEGLRALGGVQSYPSRVKDGPEVDFSTGSVGLGVAMTSFSALIQDYVRLHGLGRTDLPAGRHIAIAGDAELDEGNIYEALLEGWKHDVRDVWWIIDYNRQSLDSVVPDRLFGRIEGLFRDMGWNVVTLKYGRKLEAAFARASGDELRRWIDDCPNSLYSALTFQGGAAWRQAILADLGRSAGVRAIVDPLSDDELATLMTNLGGHDTETMIEALREAAALGDQPTCFIAYTIKGMGLPFAGHKDNHAGLMTKEQMGLFRQEMRIRPGHEWDPFEGLAAPTSELQAFLDSCPFAAKLTPEGRALTSPIIAVPPTLPVPKLGGRKMSTQSGFGDILAEIGRGQGAYADLAAHILTTSPDVTVSTNLGPWVNRRGVFDRHTRNDVFRDFETRLRPAVGHEPEGPAYRARDRRAELVPSARRGGPDALADRRAAAADRHGVRPVRQSRPRCTDLCLLPGRPLLVGLDAIGPEPGAGGRAAPVDQHAADRHGRGSVGELRAVARRRTGGPAAPRVCAYASSGRLGSVAAPVDPPTRSAVARGGPGCGDRGRALDGPARSGCPDRDRLPGGCRARGGGGVRRIARRGAGGGAARYHEP